MLQPRQVLPRTPPTWQSVVAGCGWALRQATGRCAGRAGPLDGRTAALSSDSLTSRWARYSGSKSENRNGVVDLRLEARSGDHPNGQPTARTGRRHRTPALLSALAWAERNASPESPGGLGGPEAGAHSFSTLMRHSALVGRSPRGAITASPADGFPRSGDSSAATRQRRHRDQHAGSASAERARPQTAPTPGAGAANVSAPAVRCRCLDQGPPRHSDQPVGPQSRQRWHGRPGASRLQAARAGRRAQQQLVALGPIATSHCRRRLISKCTSVSLGGRKARGPIHTIQHAQACLPLPRSCSFLIPAARRPQLARRCQLWPTASPRCTVQVSVSLGGGVWSCCRPSEEVCRSALRSGVNPGPSGGPTCSVRCGSAGLSALSDLASGLAPRLRCSLTHPTRIARSGFFAQPTHAQAAQAASWLANQALEAWLRPIECPLQADASAADCRNLTWTPHAGPPPRACPLYVLGPQPSGTTRADWAAAHWQALAGQNSALEIA